MYMLMSYQMGLLTECLITHITNIRALTTMYEFVFSDWSVDWMPYYTHHKHECSPVCMHWCLFRWVCWLNPLLHTLQTKGPSPLCMCLCYQTELLTERLITHFTSIRPLTTMYACMLYETTLVTESLITYITNIRALTTMYTLMC